MRMTANDRHVLDALGGKEIEWSTLTEEQQARVRRVSRELREGPYPPSNGSYASGDHYMLFLLGETEPSRKVWKRMTREDRARIHGLSQALR